MPELRIGSQGEAVGHWYDWAHVYAASYNFLLGRRDLYYGKDEAAFTSEMQRRLRVPVTGVFGDLEAGLTGYRWPGTTVPPKPVERRKIWLYSAPGSGVDWNVGPPFWVGEWCKVGRYYPDLKPDPARRALHINHQPVGYPKGGYLGLMGGDPRLSYNDVIGSLDKELERLLYANPDIRDPAVEFWFVAYSQSAHGMKTSVNRLFGDQGPFKHLRGRINGLIMFGDPTRRQGPTSLGNNPKGWGIARITYPKWLEDKTHSVTANGDLYACTTDDTLVPLFFDPFTRAEAELPFVMYCAQLVIPAMLQFIPVLGGVLGPAAAPLIAGMTGVAIPLIGTLIQGISGAQPPDPELVKLFTVGGLLTNLPKLIATLIALGGIMTHGEYHLPKPEFGGRTGEEAAYDIVASFRR